MTRTLYHRLVGAAVVLTFIVIVLGAWVRLTDAGLGCPDWPGCYGYLTWPQSAESIAGANERWAERPVETGKAIREMVHRYAAGLLGLVVLTLAILAWRNRRDPDQPVKLPLILLGLIMVQSMFGAWTVTLLLKPLIVLTHLAGGMLTFSLLVALLLRTRPKPIERGQLRQRAVRPLVALATVVLVVQIALGGWVSTNYAALACPDFPTCMGQWWPDSDFVEGFKPWRGIGVDFEFGVLDQDARVAIHLVHRMGALAVIAVFSWLLWRLFSTPGLTRPGAVLGTLLSAQIALGISNVVLGLPLWVAVAHNGFAALLLGQMVYLLFLTGKRDTARMQRTR